jgi:ribokinase
MKADIDVLCVGDLDMDLFITVPSIPGFDQKVAGESLGYRPGGMSANAAVAVARLGGRSRLIANVGDDESGRQARASLAGQRVDISFVREMQGTSTFMCVVMLSPSAEKALIRLDSAAYLPHVSDLDPAAFDGVRHLHMTYGNAELTGAALAMAGARNMSASLDLEPPDIRNAPAELQATLAQVDTLFLNEEAFDQAARTLGQVIHPGMLKPGGEIIVTMGADGCRRITAQGNMDAPGFAVETVDTTGAGDCFAGAYLTASLGGATPFDALVFANAAGALATQAYGAQAALPARSDVEGLISMTFSEGTADASKAF